MRCILYILLIVFISIANINCSIANVDFNNKIKISCACDKNKKNKKNNTNINAKFNKKNFIQMRKNNNIINGKTMLPKLSSKCQNKNNKWIKLKVQNNTLSNTQSSHKNIPDITNRRIKRI